MQLPVTEMQVKLRLTALMFSDPGLCTIQQQVIYKVHIEQKVPLRFKVL